MSTIEDVIAYRLLADSNVTALIGDRIFPIQAAQNTAAPLIIYTLITTEPTNLLSESVGFVGSRFQFDMWAKTKKEAKTLGNKVRASLDALSGTILGVRVDGTLYEDEFDGYDGEANLFRVSQEYRFWHNI